MRTVGPSITLDGMISLVCGSINGRFNLDLLVNVFKTGNGKVSNRLSVSDINSTDCFFKNRFLIGVIFSTGTVISSDVSFFKASATTISVFKFVSLTSI